MKNKMRILSVVLAASLLFIPGCSSTDSGSQTTTAAMTAAQATTTAVTTTTAKVTTSATTKANLIDDGTYKVGKDLAAGEYVLYPNRSSGYFAILENSSGDFDAIISNENFKEPVIVTINDGEYLKLSRCNAVPFEQAKLDTSKPGQFKVGTHLAPGEYRIVIDEDSAYYEVTTDSRHKISSIRTNDNISGNSYITLEDGEYIYLKRCHLEKDE